MVQSKNQESLESEVTKWKNYFDQQRKSALSLQNSLKVRTKELNDARSKSAKGINSLKSQLTEAQNQN